MRLLTLFPLSLAFLAGIRTGGKGERRGVKREKIGRKRIVVGVLLPPRSFWLSFLSTACPTGYPYLDHLGPNLKRRICLGLSLVGLQWVGQFCHLLTYSSEQSLYGKNEVMSRNSFRAAILDITVFLKSQEATEPNTKNNPECLWNVQIHEFLLIGKENWKKKKKTKEASPNWWFLARPTWNLMVGTTTSKVMGTRTILLK